MTIRRGPNTWSTGRSRIQETRIDICRNVEHETLYSSVFRMQLYFQQMMQKRVVYLKLNIIEVRDMYIVHKTVDRVSNGTECTCKNMYVIDKNKYVIYICIKLYCYWLPRVLIIHIQKLHSHHGALFILLTYLFIYCHLVILGTTLGETGSNFLLQFA